MVGLYAEPKPKGFGFSDTAFRVFVLMASRRLEADRFFTDDYRPEVYTPEGIDWVEDNTMRSVLLRHFPELEPALEGVANPFAPLEVGRRRDGDRARRPQPRSRQGRSRPRVPAGRRRRAHARRDLAARPHGAGGGAAGTPRARRVDRRAAVRRRGRSPGDAYGFRGSSSSASCPASPSFSTTQETFGLLYHMLDARILVPRQDDEMGRHSTDCLVLGSCRTDLLNTIRVVALTEKLQRRVVRRGAYSLDPLVDLPEEGLVPLSSVAWHR